MNVKKSLLQRLREGKASMIEKISTPKDQIAVYTAEEVLLLAQQGNHLIRGWGSTLLLRPVAHIPCVRVCSPMELRVKSLMQRLDTDDEEFIREEIEKSDAAHAAAMQSRFSVRWGDPLLYDLTLNTGRMAIETCVDYVVQLTKRPEFQETAGVARRARQPRAGGPRARGVRRRPADRGGRSDHQRRAAIP